ncbi:serine/threonine protein kinase [Methylobacillus methanolivorans]|uniref:Stress response kinase A n=1 Tax=Methylobacillus methanolivorans TaxID=1848927 RepID=A0ABW8GI72_9PROT
MTTAPFSTLTPDLILDAMGSVDILGDGRLLALNSYENRVYQVGVEEQPPVVVKFYRPDRWSEAQILEEHAFSLELVEAEIPVVAPLALGGKTLQQYQGFHFAVFPRRGGRIPELDQEGRLEWIGRFLGRIHAIGAQAAFQHRPAIDIDSFGEEPSQWLINHQFIPADLLPAYRSVVTQALDGIRACYERAGDVAVLRLHGDCHLSNMLWTDDGPHFVDFDDSRMGPAIQDLWMLLSGSPAEMSQQFAEVLEGYESFYDFNPAELHLVEALRTLRLIHYSAWLAKRWHDPAFPMTFTWFNTQQYWQDRILELREQVALMQEPPLSIAGGNR